MKKLKLYLETSVWNFLLADDAPDKRLATELLFEEIEAARYHVFVSEIVITEIARAPQDKRERLLELIREHEPSILEDSEGSHELISFYLENGLLSNDHIADMGHIAIASVGEMDVIVSWNMRHMVKLRTRTMVNLLNQRLGYRSLEICTPEEVIGFGEDA